MPKKAKKQKKSTEPASKTPDLGALFDEGETPTLDVIPTKDRRKLARKLQDAAAFQALSKEADGDYREAKDEAAAILAKYNLDKIDSEYGGLSKVKGRIGGVQVGLLKKNMLKAGLNARKIKQVLEESRGPKGDDYYTFRAPKEGT